MSSRSLVVGAGNPFRRDDGAGPAVADRLRGSMGAGTRVFATDDCGVLLNDFHGMATVVVVDATSSGADPGTISRFDAHERPLPAVFSRSSTHAFGVAEAIELARALGRLPARLIVYGIEGRDFAPGEGLSPDVDAAVDEVVRRIAREVGGNSG